MADDVEARVRVAEEELNLLKNQVQQTLLDVREHILDLVETGTGIPKGDRPAENKDAAAAPAAAPVALPPTETGGAPLPDLGGGGGLGEMPGLDMGGGLGDMPGLDMGEMPALDTGDGDGMGDMPEMDLGAGIDDTSGVDEGFDIQDAPFDGAEQASGGPGPADAPYDVIEQSSGGPGPAETRYEVVETNSGRRAPADQGGYPDQGSYPDKGSYPGTDDAGYEYADVAPPQDAPADAPEDLGEPAAEPVAGEIPATADAPISGPPPAVDAALAEMDLVTLVGVVRWVDQAVQRLGQRRVDALLDVWQMTGRISEPTKEMIQRLCALTHEDPEERVPLRDLVTMMIQMEAVLDTDESSNSRLLAMLFEEPGDPLSGLGALAPR